MTLDAARVRRIAAGVARSLKLSVEALAEGIVRVANANMERAIRVVSVERGHDPRAFSLVAFGGAGGMHACEIAARARHSDRRRPAARRRALGARHARRRCHTGLFSKRADAGGGHHPSTDLRSASRRSCGGAAASWPAKASGRSRFASPNRSTCATSASRTKSRCRSHRRFAAEFHRRHGTLYGYSNPDRAIEVVAVRVQAAALMPKLRLPFSRPRAAAARPHAVRHRAVRRRIAQDGIFPMAGSPAGRQCTRAGRDRRTGGNRRRAAWLAVHDRRLWQRDRYANSKFKVGSSKRGS